MKRTVSRRNVFEDLGFTRAEAAVHAMRIDLAAELERFVARRAFTQAEAARFFGVTQPKISRILRGRLEGFTIDYLVRMASKAGRHPRVAFTRMHSSTPAARSRAAQGSARSAGRLRAMR